MKPYDFYYIKQNMKYLGSWLLASLLFPLLFYIFFSLIHFIFFHQIGVGSQTNNFFIFTLLSTLCTTIQSLKVVPLLGYLQFANRTRAYYKPVLLMMFLDSFLIALWATLIGELSLSFHQTFFVYEYGIFTDVSLTATKRFLLVLAQSLLPNSILFFDLSRKKIMYFTSISNMKFEQNLQNAQLNHPYASDSTIRKKALSDRLLGSVLYMLLCLIFSVLFPILYLMSQSPSFHDSFFVFLLGYVTHPIILLFLSFLLFFFSYKKSQQKKEYLL